jgi:cysteine desulfurase / selenocysteine lyase
VTRFYSHDNSNIHRGAHALAVRATDAYEEARAKVQGFIGAASCQEIVWVRGATEAINLVAQSYGSQVVGPGHEVIVTTLEHHSNTFPGRCCARPTMRYSRSSPSTPKATFGWTGMPGC